MTDLSGTHEMQWFCDVPRAVRKQTIIGTTLIFVCLGGFGTWAATAPLAAAVIAQGSFVAAGRNKVVQHLEGGVIRELLVKEGAHLSAERLLVA